MTLYLAARERLSISPLVADAITVVAASVLLVIAAKISVPFYPVPMTLQTMAVISLGLALGVRRAGLAVVLYLAEGAAGFPVFTGTPERGVGLIYMMGPTGGFLIGFLFAAVFAGWLGERGWDRKPALALGAALLASVLIYVPGLLWLGSILGFGGKLLSAGLYLFLAADVLKSVLAALLVPALGTLVRKHGGQ